MRLEGFWADLAASSPIEIWLNAVTQFALSLPFTANASPYAQVPTTETELRSLLKTWVRPEDLPPDPAARIRPYLRLGVANVLAGGGAALDGESPVFSVDDIVASAAVPPLFRAVQARGVLRWDGLYAFNPPIGALLDLAKKPEEIWVVRINPRRRTEEPRSFEEIEDRRNELAGNLPLDAELDGVRLVNALLAVAPDRIGAAFGYRPVTVREVELPLPELPYRSKLDRSRAHLERLMSVGRAMAPFFFDEASITARPQG